MGGTLNQVTLVGRLGADPELRFIPSGKAVANFNICTEETWKDQSGAQQKQTDWHRIVVWGPSGEAAAKYLKKGSEVCIVGKLKTRKWDDKDGKTNYTTEVVVSGFGTSCIFLGSRADGGGGQRAQDPQYAPSPGDDDVPF